MILAEKLRKESEEATAARAADTAHARSEGTDRAEAFFLGTPPRRHWPRPDPALVARDAQLILGVPKDAPAIAAYVDAFVTTFAACAQENEQAYADQVALRGRAPR